MGDLFWHCLDIMHGDDYRWVVVNGWMGYEWFMRMCSCDAASPIEVLPACKLGLM